MLDGSETLLFGTLLVFKVRYVPQFGLPDHFNSPTSDSQPYLSAGIKLVEDDLGFEL